MDVDKAHTIRRDSTGPPSAVRLKRARSATIAGLAAARRRRRRQLRRLAEDGKSMRFPIAQVLIDEQSGLLIFLFEFAATRSLTV